MLLIDIYGKDGANWKEMRYIWILYTYKEYTLDVLVPEEASSLEEGCKQTAEADLY